MEEEKKEKKFKYKIKTEYGYEWICPVCLGTIPLYAYIPSEYAYKMFWKNRTIYFDTWTCMMKFERENHIGLRSGGKKRYYNSSKYKKI